MEVRVLSSEELILIIENFVPCLDFGISSEVIFFPVLSSWVQASMDASPFNRGRENTIWGVSLMLGYLG